jgi:aminopeptidase YwaD
MTWLAYPLYTLRMVFMVTNELLKHIWNAYSEKMAYQHVLSISRFHRIQASAGYRAAANFVLDELKIAGVDAWIESYPADEHTSFWTTSSFEEWEAEEGSLTLVEPGENAGVLADYRAVPISLIQRSISFEGTVDVILLEDGTKESDYAGIDVGGKMVLTKGNLDKVRRLAVEKFGALGILFYGMSTLPPVREPVDLPDALQYTSFWWTYYPGEKKCFGFVLSPRKGAWLRQVLLEKKAVKVSVKIKSRLFDGSLDNVVAVIPGKTQEEVVVTAHLCHPQPSANDNASGAAAMLEMACALQRLVNQGVLPKPERSLRFLWVPEMTGSSAYLSTHEAEIPWMVAGINLDMVGEDQSKTGSCLTLVNPPQALSSFTPALLEHILETLMVETRVHYSAEPFPLFRYTFTGFSGGSDHYIFSDPTVGVPMPAMIQSPDRFYHTTADTPDQVDAHMLRISGTIAATFACWVANAGKEEAAWLATEVQAHFRVDLARKLQREFNGLLSAGEAKSKKSAAEWLKKHADHALRCHLQALASLVRVDPDVSSILPALESDAARLTVELFAQYQPVVTAFHLDGAAAGEKDPWEEKAAALTPTRLYSGPARYERLAARLTQVDRDDLDQLFKTHEWAYDMTSLAEYWADGKRTCLEITDLIELECGLRDAELVVKTFIILEKFGLVSISRN